jgi:hypothetical protein
MSWRRVVRRGCALLLLPVLLAIGGCGANARSASAPPLGRPIAAGVPPAGQAPAPVGDPVPERGGTVPAGLAGGENAPAAGAAAFSPEAALRRYALAYTNWQAATLVAHEHQLAALAVGPARLAALQTAAALGGDGELIAHRVHGGHVCSRARAEGRAGALGHRHAGADDWERRVRWAALVVTRDACSRRATQGRVGC